MVHSVAAQRAAAVSRTCSGELQNSLAVRGHNAQIEIHQHRRLRRVRIMASGARRALAHHVHLVPLETAVREHAVGNVVAFVAQSVVA